jgi:hypothetical protein
MAGLVGDIALEKQAPDITGEAVEDMAAKMKMYLVRQ